MVRHINSQKVSFKILIGVKMAELKHKHQISIGVKKINFDINIKPQ